MYPIGHDHPVAASVLYAAHPSKVAPRAPTVIIIDHDAAVRDALSVMLRTSGFGALSFSSARHFLQTRPLVENGCLLVEFDLEDMKGTDLIACLAAERVELPTVIMSARLRSPVVKEALLSSIVTVLQKPFGRDELMTSLQLVIDQLK